MLKKSTQDNEKITVKSTKNLSQFMEIGQYYDYTIIDTNNIDHRLHKLVLACHSDYFQAIFDASFQESCSAKSNLSFPDPRKVLLRMFKWMYTSQADVSAEIAVPLLQQCEYYQVNELSTLLKDKLETEFLPHHAFQILKDAVEFKMTDIVTLASDSLAETFESVDWIKWDLNFLPFDVMLDLLNNSLLTLKSENTMYQVLANYTAGKSLLFYSD